MIFCTVCGLKNENTSKFCIGCGAPLSQKNNPNTSASKNVNSNTEQIEAIKTKTKTLYTEKTKIFDSIDSNLYSSEVESNLIECPDCKKGFSYTAKQCPNCGFNWRSAKRKILFLDAVDKMSQEFQQEEEQQTQAHRFFRSMTRLSFLFFVALLFLDWLGVVQKSDLILNIAVVDFCLFFVFGFFMNITEVKPK